MERRRFIRSAFGYGLVMSGVFALAPSEGRGDIVRPPGARPEREFSLVCLRCGRCVEVCPTNAVESLAEGALEMVGTPRITGGRGACVFCYRCTANCPTQALRLADVAEQRRRGDQPKLGSVALAHPERCIRCLRCEGVCPFTAADDEPPGERQQVIRILRLLDPPSRGSLERELARIEGHCTGCGHCVIECPTEALALRPSRRKVVTS